MTETGDLVASKRPTSVRPPISLLRSGTRIKTFATKRSSRNSWTRSETVVSRMRARRSFKVGTTSRWGHAQRVQYGTTFAQGKRAKLEVSIDNTDRVWNKILFGRLMEGKESIESDLSEILESERMDDRRASRIAVVCKGSIDDAPETLKEIEDWMIDKLLDFKRVFGPRLDELATDRPDPGIG